MKHTKMHFLPRDFHKLAIVRGEAQGKTQVIPNTKRYTRKVKHKCKAVD